MTIYRVDEYHRTHICPGDPDLHPISVARTVVHVTDGGPCRAPVTIRCGTRTVEIPCGRHEPAHRQCGACRTIVTTRTITAEPIRHEVAPHPAPNAVTGPLSCAVCGEPLAVVLAEWGVHLLCGSRTTHGAAVKAAA